jgi:release factor glutamine methyltransferase
LSAAPAARTAGELVAWAAARLAAVSATARLEAELLLAASAGLDRMRVIAYPERRLTPTQAEQLGASVERRSSGEPLAYILGRREFYSLELEVGPDVLVPRPETELLVELALAQDLPAGAGVLDLGTGSGAIALALKSQRPDLDLVAVDCSPAALAVAAGNGRRLGLAVRWRQSDWFGALAGSRFALIVSNPPYVASGDSHFDGPLRHEPRLALDGGASGLDACGAILAGAAAHLTAAGMLLFEHGCDQRAELIALAASHGFTVAALAEDLAGRPRVAAFVMADAG